MFMIITALYCEAAPLIQSCKLKKDNTIHKFQVFQNEEMLLIITGTGSIAAAVGVSFLCNLHPPKQEDFLINIGLCGSEDMDASKGSLFLCNQLSEQTTGRSFYPDILFRHPFHENSVITCARLMRHRLSDRAGEVKSVLYDMEAAAVYQSGAYYVQPHQMIFFKIISDHGEDKLVGAEEAEGLVEQNTAAILEWLHQLYKVKLTAAPAFTEEEEAVISRLSALFRCSVTMGYQLRQSLLYYKLEHGGFLELTQEFFGHDMQLCKTKTEGKKYYEQLKKRLV